MPINLTPTPQKAVETKVGLPRPDVTTEAKEVNGRAALVSTIIFYLPEDDQVEANKKTRMGKKTFNDNGSVKLDNSDKVSSQLVTYGQVDDVQLVIDQNGEPFVLRDDEHNGSADIVLRAAIFSRQQFGEEEASETPQP